MKIYNCLLTYLFFGYLFKPTQAALGLELTLEEETAIIARYSTLSFEEFKKEYIDKISHFV